jgi:copper chaperone CopZ
MTSRKAQLALSLSLSLTILVGCDSGNSAASDTKPAQVSRDQAIAEQIKADEAALKDIQGPRVTLAVEGMVCTGCEGDVREALDGTPGLKAFRVSHLTKKAILVLDEKSPANVEAICKKLADAGHEAKVLAAATPDAAPKK